MNYVTTVCSNVTSALKTTNARKHQTDLKRKPSLKHPPLLLSSSQLKKQLNGEAHLEVRQLSEGLTADVALVLDLAVLLLQRVRQRLVAGRVPPSYALNLSQVHGLVLRVMSSAAGRGGLGGHPLAGGCRARGRGPVGGRAGVPMGQGSVRAVGRRVGVVGAGLVLQGGGRWRRHWWGPAAGSPCGPRPTRGGGGRGQASGTVSRPRRRASGACGGGSRLL